jgi:ribonuclease HI
MSVWPLGSGSGSALTNLSNRVTLLEYPLSDEVLLESNVYPNPDNVDNPLHYRTSASFASPLHSVYDMLPPIIPFFYMMADKQALVYCSGFCQPPPFVSAGCAFITGPISGDTYQFCLEDRGADRRTHTPTENRAHLRAVLAAIGATWDPFWDSLVVATDSEYIARCGAHELGNWIKNAGNDAEGNPVEDWDLWDLVIARMLELRLNYGIRVQFWRIPREYNRRAFAAAQNAALNPAPEVTNFPRVNKMVLPKLSPRTQFHYLRW